jgi:hypothetical protein
MSEDTPKFERKIIHLPGTKLTPEVVLHRTLTKLPHIKAVTIIIQWDDDSYAVDWSSMRVSELSLASMTLENTARKEFFKDE